MTTFSLLPIFVSTEMGQGEVVDGGGFAGDAVVVHGVDTVGGDVHFEEVAVGSVGAEAEGGRLRRRCRGG